MATSLSAPVSEVKFEPSATILNLAGRQRLLTFKAVSEVLLELHGLPSTWKKSIHLLRSTASALLNGGEAILSTAPDGVEKKGTLPPPPISVRGSLARQDSAIDQLESAAVALNTAAASQTEHKQIEDLWKAAQNCYAAADATVSELNTRFNADADALADDERRSRDRLNQMVNHVSEVVQTLAASSEELTAVSGQMKNYASETFTQLRQAHQASGALEQGMQSISSSAVQLSASIQQVASISATAASGTEMAVKAASRANDAIIKLAVESDSIRTTLKLIGSVAEQTNLLALNATIEAARAGEAGRGFAVVAKEVKDLAKSSGRAAEDISLQIQNIRHEVKAATEAVDEIRLLVKEISESSDVIARAVAGQSSTAREISRNVGSSVDSAAQISANFKRVTETAEVSAASSRDIQTASGDLAQTASSLEQFIASTRK